MNPVEFNHFAQAMLSHNWRFAKSMPRFPHWYTLRKDWHDDQLFDKVVNYMKNNGYAEWYRTFKWTKYLRFNLNGYKYWIMKLDEPTDKVGGINRAVLEPPQGSIFQDKKGVTVEHEGGVKSINYKCIDTASGTVTNYIDWRYEDL